MGVSNKAHSEGSTFPEHSDPNLLRIYSYRFCPYAQRTRLLVKHLKVPHEEVNVNLQSKPDWFKARTPVGAVPVLEFGNKILYESAICNEYLNEVYGGGKLLPSDPYVKARVKILMELFSKIVQKFYGLMGQTTKDKEKDVDEVRKNLEKYEEAIGTGEFFGDKEPNLLDFHIYPWFERFPTVEKITNLPILSDNTFPRLNAWVHRMRDIPAVKETSLSDEIHFKFVESYVKTGSADPDMGL